MGTRVHVRLDTSPPDIQFSGPLSAAGAITTQATQFTVTATDGSQTSDATRRSGVKRLDVYVDSALAWTTGDQPCATDSCQLSLSPTYDAADWGEGLHEIRAEAIDEVGNPKSSKSIYPLISFSGSQSAAEAFALNSEDETPTNQGDGSTVPDACTASTQTGCGDLQTNSDARDAALPELSPRSAGSGALPATAWGLADNSFAYVPTNGDVYSTDDPDPNHGLPAAFADPRLPAFGFHWYRIIVPWDIGLVGSHGDWDPMVSCDRATGRNPDISYTATYKVDYEQFQRWYNALTAYINSGANVQLFVSFQKSPCLTPDFQRGWSAPPGTQANMSVPNQYGRALDFFRKNYPLVTHFSAWNEPNLASAQPWKRNKKDVGNDPRLVNLPVVAGQIWGEDWDRCQSTTLQIDGVTTRPKCVVFKGEFADNALGQGTGSSSYIGRYMTGLGPKQNEAPWAYHPYSTIRALKTNPNLGVVAGQIGNLQYLDNFLTATKSGNVWLTETAALQYRAAKDNVRDSYIDPAFQPDQSKQDDAMRWILTTLLNHSSRINHLFYFQWASSACAGSGDTICNDRKTTALSPYYRNGGRSAIGSGLVPDVLPSGVTAPPETHAACWFRKRNQVTSLGGMPSCP